MLTLRCTAKVLRRMGITRPEEPPPSTGRLRDWYVNLIFAGRTQRLLIVSEATRLPVVMPATNLRSLPVLFPKAAAEVLREIGVEESAVEEEIETMSEVAIGRTASRSVLATINDFALSLKWQLQINPDLSFLETSVKLADTPCGPIDYQFPGEATVELLGGKYRRSLLDDFPALSVLPRWQIDPG